MKNRYDPEVHRRRSIRLKGYDYSRPGAYFVTIVVRDRLCLFGDVEDGEMRLNEMGMLLVDAWEWLGRRRSYVELDAYVVMPNHLHGIVVLTDEGWGGSNDHGGRGGSGTSRGGSRTAPTGSGSVARGAAGTARKSLGRLVGAFKTVSTKRFNEMNGTPGQDLWQRNYFERIIRNEQELDFIREYIERNPAKWETDEENPDVNIDREFPENV